MTKQLLLLTLVVLAGCQFPQMRVFEAKVPEKIEKTEKQTEAERSAAKLVAVTITEPEQMRVVAEKLSQSLGEPKKEIDSADLDRARDEALKMLLKGSLAQQSQLDALNAKLEKYAGKKIEGTGFNLFGLSPLVLIALAFLCPSAVIPVLLFVLRRAKGALMSTVEGIQNFKVNHPEAAGSINSALDGAQDRVHKTLIRKLKTKLD